ncbi:MAG TPA: hypothetical protein VFF16_16870 [Telluria sp.]|nr:hypothetical protein [Telluria sp.]
MALATVLVYLLTYLLNGWLFGHLEFATGIHWVYLPAGVRLLAVLLFGTAGVLGLLLASSLVCFLWLFPYDVTRALAGGIAAAAAPWLVNLCDRRVFGLRPSLSNLSPQRLLWNILAFSLAGPLLHHLWYVVHGDAASWRSLFAMFWGDLTGTVLVIYAVKALVSLMPRAPRA